MKRKGIILAGGKGTRLYPATQVINKQLLPIYDKPMIYYSLTTLMLAKIQDIMIISSPDQLPHFKDLLGDGSQWGINLNYEVQSKPEGIAQSFIIAKDFIQNNPVTLILGDNIFYGESFSQKLQKASAQEQGASVFAYQVSTPEDFGVVEFDDNFNALSLEEKPSQPKSNFAVTGLYFYDNDIIAVAESLKPSARGEYEITDANKVYLTSKKLHVEVLDKQFTWFDTGNHYNFFQASSFMVQLEQEKQIRVAYPEEVAHGLGWISKEQLQKQASKLQKSSYGKYLLSL